MRKVNRSLGKSPALGPIPSELMLPFMGAAVIAGMVWWLTDSMEAAALIGLTLILSAVILLGRTPWKFLSSWQVPPRYLRAPRRYQKRIYGQHDHR